MEKVVKVYIAHSWGNMDELRDLCDSLNAYSAFEAQLSPQNKVKSVSSSEATAVKQKLMQEIAISNVMLAVAGIFTRPNSWMEWEMDTARKNGLKVVGVVPHGDTGVSQLVSARAVEQVKWNIDAIVQSIRRHAN